MKRMLWYWKMGNLYWKVIIICTTRKEFYSRLLLCLLMLSTFDSITVVLHLNLTASKFTRKPTKLVTEGEKREGGNSRSPNKSEKCSSARFRSELHGSEKRFAVIVKFTRKTNQTRIAESKNPPKHQSTNEQESQSCHFKD